MVEKFKVKLLSRFLSVLVTVGLGAAVQAGTESPQDPFIIATMMMMIKEGEATPAVNQCL